MFGDKFEREFRRIKGKSKKPSRLDGLRYLIKKYNEVDYFGDYRNVKDRLLGTIEKELERVKKIVISKPLVKNVVKKYRVVFTALEKEIGEEKRKVQPSPERETKPFSTGPRPRAPFQRRESAFGSLIPAIEPSRSHPRELKEESKGRKNAAMRPRHGGPRTAEQKAQSARRGRRKLKAALATRKAIKGTGYDVDWKEDFAPAELKEEKEVSHKLLEPEMIWEVADPKHRQGKILNKLFNKWRQSDSPLGFWLYLEYYKGDVGYEVHYIPGSQLPSYEVQCGKPESKSGSKLLKGGAPLGTENALSVSEQLERGWEIYVQSMSGEIYSGPALQLDRVTIEDNRRVVQWTCPFLHHSSFLHGRPIRCAGEWKVKDGKLISISALTGHYKTPPDHFRKFLLFLRGKGVNLGEITVKWPWRTMGRLDIRYYNGRDFLNTASAEYLQPPMDRSDIPIREVWPHDQPNNYRKVTRYNFFVNKDLIPAGDPSSFNQFNLDETNQVILHTYYYDLELEKTYQMEWLWYDPAREKVVIHSTVDYKAKEDNNSTISGLKLENKQIIPRGQFTCQHKVEGEILFATHFSLI